MVVCLRYTRSRADAEDVLQEGFIKVFDHLSQFRGEGSLEGWIRRIMITAALKKYQRFYYQKEINSLEDVPFEPTQSGGDVVSLLSLQELLALIQRLPDGYRMVFNLFVIEGYSHDEIAKMLQIEAGTSRSQLNKARRLLQQWILTEQKIAL